VILRAGIGFPTGISGVIAVAIRIFFIACSVRFDDPTTTLAAKRTFLRSL
jgi:hypothetical protein